MSTKPRGARNGQCTQIKNTSMVGGWALDRYVLLWKFDGRKIHMNLRRDTIDYHNRIMIHIKLRAGTGCLERWIKIRIQVQRSDMDPFKSWFCKSKRLNWWIPLVYNLHLYMCLRRDPCCHLLVALGIPLSENIALNTFYTRMHTNNNSAKIKIKII